MARQEAQAKYDRLHEDRQWHDGTFTSWAQKPSSEHPYHRSHGVTIWVAGEELGLGGEFLGSGALDGVDDVERAESEKHEQHDS